LGAGVKIQGDSQMASDARPLCLCCGHLMNVASATDASGELKSFQRQHLVCPNCGDTDSRFVSASAEVASRNEAMGESPALTAAGVEEFAPARLAASDSASSFLIALLAKSGTQMPSHSETRTPPEVDQLSAEPPQSAEPSVDEDAVAANKKFT